MFRLDELTGLAMTDDVFTSIRPEYESASRRQNADYLLPCVMTRRRDERDAAKKNQ